MKSVSTKMYVSKTMPKVNRASQVHFVKAIATNEFDAHPNVDRLHVKRFLNRIMSPNTVPEKKIFDVMRVKPSVRSKPLNRTMFADFPDHNLQKLSTAQVCQVLRATLANATYTEEDRRICAFFYNIFRARQSFMAPTNGGQFLQTVSKSADGGSVTTLDITTQSVTKVPSFFKREGMIKKAVHAKAPKCSC